MMGTLPNTIQPARNAAATRQSILVAARRLFARDTYENVSVRDIAGEVGVDPSLVIRYFGSKEELFRAVLHDGSAGSMLEGATGETLPAHLLSLITEGEENDEERNARLERVLIIMRSASSSRASVMAYEAVEKLIIEPMAALLDTPDARPRACTAMMVLSGIGMMHPMLAAVYGDPNDVMRRRLLALLEASLCPAATMDSCTE